MAEHAIRAAGNGERALTERVLGDKFAAVSYLGLDIGGSKSRFEWWPDDFATGGLGASVHPAVHHDVAERLAVVLRAAAPDGSPAAAPTAAVVAMAGADAALRLALPQQLRGLGVAYPVAIVGDVLAAAAAGLRDGPGLLLWSGTGSFAIARNDDGQLVRCGGRGYAFGDEGSGYDLMRRAITAVLQAVDGRGRETQLTELLTAAFDAPAPERLGAVAQNLSPREVAARLPVLLQAFEQDDWVAADILENGMHQLVELGRAALAKAGMKPGPGLRVALGGGVLERSELIRDGLSRALQASFGGELIVKPLAATAAAKAAAWLAAGWHAREAPQTQWVEDVAL